MAETSTTATGETTPKTKAVSWKTTVIVRVREAYTSKDKRRAWCSEDDLARFREDRQLTRQFGKQYKSIWAMEDAMGDIVTYRGLERYWSAKELTRRRERIVLSKSRVLETQEDLVGQSCPDYCQDRIAQEYSKVTQHAGKEAVTRALVYLAEDHSNDLHQASLATQREGAGSATKCTTEQDDTSTIGTESLSESSSDEEGARGEADLALSELQPRGKHMLLSSPPHSPTSIVAAYQFYPSLCSTSPLPDLQNKKRISEESAER